MPGTEQELQEAIFDLHEYLSDHKAPLMVADSVALLLEHPPEFLAAQIHAWVGAQPLGAPAVDYLYHGAKKIALMGEFELVPRDGLVAYLRQLGGALLEHCPEADRDLLRQSLERLAQAAAANVASVPATVSRPAAPPAPVALPSSKDPTLSREVRRLSLLLEHLRPLVATAAPAEERTEATSQFMTTAAEQARSTLELDQNLAPLRQLGIDTETEQVFRTLAQSLAGWALPPTPSQPLAVSRDQLQAMQKIVSLGEDPADVAKRFRQMVHAAIEQFNQGQLGRAVTMFDLAEKMAAEQKVQPVFVSALRTGHQYLDQERLRTFADRQDARAQLRSILDFFVDLRPKGLLKALEAEPRRERRHQLLALLEVHEQAARKEAWEQLKASVEGGLQIDVYLQRNLLYLLRVIPRPEDKPVEEEVNVALRVPGRSTPALLVKEVIAFLGHSRHDKAERALVSYMKSFENMLLQPETAAFSAEDVEVILDRICAALARYGTPRAWRLLVEHGLKTDPRLGDTFLRLAEAGRADLSSAPDLVEKIAGAIRAELPRGGMLGLVGGKKDEDKAVSLIHGLAGTPLPQVYELLEEIAQRYADRKLGEAATKALNALGGAGKPAAASAGLSGDLEFFGLPSLMQTIGQSQLSGVLSLLNVEGKPQATLLFENGRFRGGQSGRMRGQEAVYQVLERPFPGTFAFVSRTDVATQPQAAPPQDVFPLLMEGVRRYDELKQASAVVSDGARLKPTGKPHTPPQEEDAQFAAEMWNELSAGKSPSECEAAVTVDPYRVRRLAAHWVEEGALQEG